MHMEVTPTRFSGSKIGDVLSAQGRRRDWLAAQVGVSASTVTRWINGDIAISRAHAERVASVLGVPFFVIAESRKSYKESFSQESAPV
jgi:transcriptional regulator with XRE-family HTH domain